MESPTTVRISDVRAGLLAILAVVEQNHGSDLELDADYYWHLPIDAAFDMKPNPEIDVGQLSDDISELNNMLDEREDGEIYVWHDLDHLIGILQRLVALDLPSQQGDRSSPERP